MNKLPKTVNRLRLYSGTKKSAGIKYIIFHFFMTRYQNLKVVGCTFCTGGSDVLTSRFPCHRIDDDLSIYKYIYIYTAFNQRFYIYRNLHLTKHRLHLKAKAQHRALPCLKQVRLKIICRSFYSP